MAVNTLVQALFNLPNTIYKITKNITLAAGETITIPANCCLDFLGGSIIGDDICINSENRRVIIKGYNEYNIPYRKFNFAIISPSADKVIIPSKFNTFRYPVTEQFVCVSYKFGNNSNDIITISLRYNVPSGMSNQEAANDPNNWVISFISNSNILGNYKYSSGVSFNVKIKDNYLYFKTAITASEIIVSRLWGYLNIVPVEVGTDVTMPDDGVQMPLGRIMDLTSGLFQTIYITNDDVPYLIKKGNNIIAFNSVLQKLVYIHDGKQYAVTATEVKQ